MEYYYDDLYLENNLFKDDYIDELVYMINTYGTIKAIHIC